MSNQLTVIVVIAMGFLLLPSCSDEPPPVPDARARSEEGTETDRQERPGRGTMATDGADSADEPRMQPPDGEHVAGATEREPASLEFDPKADAVRDIVRRLLDLSENNQLQTDEARSLLAGKLEDVEAVSFGFSRARVDTAVFAGRTRAAVRVYVSAEEVDEQELYFHLVRRGQWRMTALRAMALPPLMNTLLDDLEAQKSLSQQDRIMRDNLRLTLRNDAELHEWFKEHRGDLDDLVAHVRESFAPGESVRFESESAHPALQERLLDLSLMHLTLTQDRQVHVLVGGIVDNSVGFIHAPEDDPPALNPEEYIWVEPLGDGWYLYRTT